MRKPAAGGPLLGMQPTKGGHDDKEAGYFVNARCTQRFGILLILLSVTLVAIGLTTSSTISEQRHTVELQEGRLHKDQIQDMTLHKQQNAKLIKTLSLMQAHMTHESIKERKLKRAIRRFAASHKLYAKQVARLMAKLEGAVGYPPEKLGETGGGQHDNAHAVLKSVKVGMGKMLNDFLHASQGVERAQNWAEAHDKRRASRAANLRQRISDELKAILEQERAEEIREAAHAAADPGFAHDLRVSAKKSASQLESMAQAEVGRIIFKFRTFFKSLPRITVDEAVLEKAVKLLKDTRGNRVPVQEAEEQIADLAEGAPSFKRLMQPWGDADGRSHIERFETAVLVATFLPKIPLVAQRFERWGRHELSDVEMMLFLQTHAGRLLPLVVGVEGEGKAFGALQVTGHSATLATHEQFKRRRKDMHLNTRREARRTKLLEFRKRVQTCLAVHDSGHAWTEIQRSMCGPLGIDQNTSSKKLATVKKCLDLTDPKAAVAAGKAHSWGKAEKQTCGEIGMGPDGAEEMAWCMSLDRDSSTTWTDGVKRTCARYAIGPDVPDRDEYF
eukprot:g7593.t1